MELSERKRAILAAVVECHIENAEPVGSKLIMQRTGMGLSSATIRNEMAELEELGHLYHPHTSAGRMPTEQGYRTYVDLLNKSYQLTEGEMRRINTLLGQRLMELERLAAEAGRMVAELTNYVSVTVSPKADQSVVSRFEVVPIDSKTMLLIVVTSDKRVWNKLYVSGIPLGEDFAGQLKKVLNEGLTDIPLDLISLPMLVEIGRRIREISLDIYHLPVLEFISEALSEIAVPELHLDGAVNMLELPEYRDSESVKRLYAFLDDKRELASLFSSERSGDGVRVYIGGENESEKLRENSVVMGNYRFGEKARGSIAIIGPMRMDYRRVVSQIAYFTKAISDMLGFAPDQDGGES